MVRSSSIRLTSALLALVWVTAPLAAVFHGMGEVHRYCVEHRGFEEGAEATRTAGAAGHEQVDEGRDHSTDHEACAFQAAWRSDQTLRGFALHAVTATPGTGTLTVTLRHLPPLMAWRSRRPGWRRRCAIAASLPSGALPTRR